MTTNSVQFPRGLSKTFGYLQLVGRNNKDSNAVLVGKPLAFSAGNRKKLFALVLRADYDPQTGLVRVGVEVKNFAVSDDQAKRTVVVADVTVGYRS